MENRKKAIEFFHAKPERLNCAQAVAKSYQEKFNIPEEIISNFKDYGGGRAPEGTCGALYAANYILCTQGMSDVVDKFKKIAGSTKCRELKREFKFPCEDCVSLGDRLVAEKLSIKD